MKALYSIVGMKHRGSEELVASLKDGEPLTLVREPTNAYDPNAVQVWAQGTHVGYVKATNARALARYMDAGGKTAFVGKLTFGGDRWPMAEVEE